MLIKVSKRRLSELRGMGAYQLLLELSDGQIKRAGLAGFVKDGTYVAVYPKPSFRRIPTAAMRALIKRTHNRARITEAERQEVDYVKTRFYGRKFEAFRQHLVTYSRDNWVALYPSITWWGCGEYPSSVVFYAGDKPVSRRAHGFENMAITCTRIDGYARTRRVTNKGCDSFCVPRPEIERRIDNKSMRELYLLANCYLA